MCDACPGKWMGCNDCGTMTPPEDLPECEQCPECGSTDFEFITQEEIDAAMGSGVDVCPNDA